MDNHGQDWNKKNQRQHQSGRRVDGCPVGFPQEQRVEVTEHDQDQSAQNEACHFCVKHTPSLSMRHQPVTIITSENAAEQTYVASVQAAGTVHEIAQLAIIYSHGQDTEDNQTEARQEKNNLWPLKILFII